MPEDVSPAPAPALSIVAPVYNEAAVLPELVARCTRAGEACGMSFEVVLADDASTDATPQVLEELARDRRLRPHRLARNAGQFGATKAGLQAARGELVVVLDGDLQDPPEHIPALVAAMRAAPPSVAAVLAVKSQRDDPALFMFGQYLFHRLQDVLSRVALPAGAGSYCLMRQAIAQRVATASMTRANLSAVVAVAAAASGATLLAVPYEKAARYDDQTRVGWQGLISEALESLEITGALARLLGLAAGGLAIGAVLLRHLPIALALCLIAAAAAAALAIWVDRRARRALASVRAPQSS